MRRRHGCKPSFIGNFPEAFSAARNFPDGALQSYQQHRLRLWSSYDVPLARFGTLSVSGLWRVDSAQVFSLRTVSPALTATQAGILAAAGYPDAPATAGPSNYYVFFGDRGAGRLKGFSVFDTSISFNVPVARTVRPYIKVDVFNLFDNRELIAWNVTVRADNASPKDALGLATGYTNGPTFGTATGNTISLSRLTVNAFPMAYNGALPGGRTLRVAFGVRF